MSDRQQGIRLKHAWVVWALFGLLSACKLYVQGGAAGYPISFASAFLLGQFNAHLYFLATIPVLSLSERFGLGRVDRLALHALGCVVFSAVVSTVQNILQLWLSHPAGLGATAPAHIAPAVLDKFNEGVCVYWLAVLAPHAYAHYTRRVSELSQPPPLDAEPTHVATGALRARLRPHFLFNTLNTIATLMHEDVEAAEAMLIDTSAFLRGTLSEAREVPLRFELDTLKGYLHMEAARFEEKVSVRVEAAPAVEWAFVPNMLLLPLAENAVIHGAARSDSERRIEVVARREGDWLCIRMSNDCDGGAAEETSPRHGTGLAKTGARLSHFYGPSHRFEARYSPGVGFTVNIEIPFRVHSPAA